MKYSLAVAALAAVVAATPAPQAVTAQISPSAAAPSGCATSYPGTFTVSTVNATTARSKRQADTLQLTLNGGVLKDALNRIGYIASNRQFQFDGPPQAGAIFTSGFSVCGNGTLALGGSAIWWSCLSGDFSNLYDQSQGAQCSQIFIQALGGSSSAGASQAQDGQPAAATGASQLSDGQPQGATSAAAGVSQISDGQPQANTRVSSTAAAVTQISDGQIQATNSAPSSAAAVTQISDGQIQASTRAASSATSSAARVTQISDGQIQATTAAPSATSSAARISQISDGQIQATTAARNATAVTSAPVQFTGAAVPIRANELFAVAAGIVGAVAML